MQRLWQAPSRSVGTYGGRRWVETDGVQAYGGEVGGDGKRVWHVSKRGVRRDSGRGVFATMIVFADSRNRVGQQAVPGRGGSGPYWD